MAYRLGGGVVVSAVRTGWRCRRRRRQRRRRRGRGRGPGLVVAVATADLSRSQQVDRNGLRKCAWPVFCCPYQEANELADIQRRLLWWDCSGAARGFPPRSFCAKCPASVPEPCASPSPPVCRASRAGVAWLRRSHPAQRKPALPLKARLFSGLTALLCPMR